MPTYAQLQAEQWWNREIVTDALDWLGDELCRRTGRPRDAAGSKGDNWHLYGAHRSQEWILNSRFCTSRTYTVQAGLTDLQKRYIGGFDFTPGSVEDMIAQSRRLLAAMKAGLLDEVLEIYCNVDGDRIVDGWDNIHDRAITSDDSHLWHWHLTIDRRHLTDMSLMRRIVAFVLGDKQTAAQPTPKPHTVEEDDMTLIDRQIPTGFAFDENGELLDPAAVLSIPLPGLNLASNTIPWGQGYLSAVCDAFGAGSDTARLRIAVHHPGGPTVTTRDIRFGQALGWSDGSTLLPDGTTQVVIGRQRRAATEQPGGVVASVCLEIGRRAS